MARTTKAALEARLSTMEADNVRLRQELAQLQQTQTKSQPTVPTMVSVAFTPDNPVFAGLPRFEPHTRIVCPVHKASQANKIGVCVLCACERARGGRAAA